MKVLIWIGCFFVATVLNTILGYVTGFKIGFFIFYPAVYFVAKKLCDKWEQHKHNSDNITYTEENNDSILTQIDRGSIINSADIIENKEGISDTNKICFCRKCGEKLIDNSRFCRKCGIEIVIVEED